MRLLAEEKPGVRPEIQALRAAAVLMVLVYHFWPATLPGGYAGVDVFFVISGFLITSHLLREVTRDGRVNLGQFWARRARRLLPASLLVIVVSAIGVWAFVPITFWQDWFRQAGAAVAYVLNWELAASSIDYLAAENNASPVQHYWSLSVEEQFYLAWPLLILLGIWIAGKRFSRETVIATVLGIVTVGSFAYSIWLTVTNPAQAYFVTPTRAWEFGIGGLLAFVRVAPPLPVRAALGWIGLAGIFATAFTFTSSTPFPGYAALLPVLATAAVIWAGPTPQGWSLAQLARFRPVQYTGDISYSLYLWHWPLIVIVPYILDRELTWVDLAVLFVVSFALAALTKRFVEEPGRRAAFFTQRRPRFTLLGTAALMAIALVIPAGGFLTARAATSEAATAVKEILQESPECLGAAAMVDDCGPSELGNDLYPSLAGLKSDTGIAYDCYNNSPQNGIVETCTYGSKRADAVRVAITGDSHGAMMVSALVAVAEERNWTIDTYVSRGCTWADEEFAPEPLCEDYRAALQVAFESGEYDVVVTTARQQLDQTPAEVLDFASARAIVWSALIDEGVDVIAIIDNPLVPETMVDCVIEQPSEALAETACVMPRDSVVSETDTASSAAQIEPRAGLIDLVDLYCDDERCPMVIGNVVVYRDAHHLTNTYILTEAPFIADRIQEAVAE